MADRWRVTIPGIKAFEWEGSVSVEGGSLTLTKPEETNYPFRMYAPNAWTSVERLPETTPVLPAAE